MYQNRAAKSSTVFDRVRWRAPLDFFPNSPFLTFLKPLLSRELNEKSVRKVFHLQILKNSSEERPDSCKKIVEFPQTPNPEKSGKSHVSGSLQ